MRRVLIAALLLVSTPAWAEEFPSPRVYDLISRVYEQVRDGSNTRVTLFDADGDSTMDAPNNALRVNCVTGCSAGGSFADNATFTFGGTSISVLGGVLDDTAPNAATENSAAAARITAQRALHVNLRDASGNEVSVGGGTQYAEDSIHVSGDTMTLAGVVRNDAGTALAADGDRTVLQVDANGALRVASTGGAAGTEYTEDAIAVANPVAPALSLVRDDVLSGQTTADGDIVTARGTDKGEIYVKHVDAIPVTDNGGALTVDGTVAVTATDLDIRDLTGVTDSVTLYVNGNPVAGANSLVGNSLDGSTIPSVALTALYSVAGHTAAIDGAFTGLRMSQNRNLYNQIRDAAGNERGANVTAQNELLVELGAGAASIGTLGANSGVDIGDVTINNAAGASAVNVQDGGNSLTVDGSVTVADGGGSLTVDGSVTADTEATAAAALADNTANPTVGALGSYSFIFDGTNWDRWTGAVTATNLDIRDLANATDSVTAHQGGAWSVSITQGGNTAAVNASSQLSVNCANCSGSGVSHQDETAFTIATSNMVPIGGIRDDTTPDAVTENNAAVARITENRALHVNLRDATGAEVSVGGGTQYAEDTAGADAQQLTMAGVVRRDTPATTTTADGDRTELSVNATGSLYVSQQGEVTVNGTVTNTVSGVATGLGQFEDDPHASADGGVAVWAVRDDSLGILSGTDGDYEPLHVDASGSLYTRSSPTVNMCQDATQVDSVVIETSADAQLVAISGSTVIYVCGYNFIAAGTVNVRLVNGTGSVCATGLTAETGTYQLTAQTGISVSNGGSIQFKTDAGDALCIDVSAAVTVSGIVTYVQR